MLSLLSHALHCYLFPLGYLTHYQFCSFPSPLHSASLTSLPPFQRGDGEGLGRLVVILRSQTRTWTSQFLNYGGFVALVEVLQHSKSRETKNIALQALVHLVYTEVGLKRFLALPELAAPLAIMLMIEDDAPTRIQLLQLFSFVCTVDLEVGYSRVYTALASPQLGRTPFRVSIYALIISLSLPFLTILSLVWLCLHEPNNFLCLPLHFCLCLPFPFLCTPLHLSLCVSTYIYI